MTRLSIRLFGEPAVTFDGKPWKWSAPPRCFPLLALLSLAPHGAPTRSWLSSTIWPDDLEADARSNLRRHLHRLVRALPAIEGIDWILGDERTISWNADAPAAIDVRAFEEAIGDPARRAEAVELYRGDLLEGFYDEYVLAERERLRTAYVDALAELVREARSRRDFSAAARYAERLLSADEWREEALREWMSAKYAAGDRSAALAGYERFARRLREDFSSQPMPETMALRDAVRAGLPLPDDPETALEARPAAGSAWKSPFVGRSEQMEKVRAAWARAARKSGSVAFVSGEAGIGKSRLVAELVATVREQGGQALVGTTSHPEGEPYQAVLSALRAGLPKIAHAQVEKPWLAALAEVLPEISNFCPEANEAAATPADRARERLFEAFVRVVGRLGAMRPLCVVLEDLHWAGPATLDVLAALARRIGTLPVLVAVTFRSEESIAGEPLRELRAQLVAERRAIAVPLERLTPDDVARVVEAAAGENARLSDSVAALSEGNPLFAVQLLEGYRESGCVPDAGTALRSIGEVIASRASRLDERVRAVAETAATLGQAFAADDVAAIGGWEENDVLEAIGTLIDRALVREAGGGALEYAFTHALVAAALYESSDPEQRAARHRRAARILERRHGNDRIALVAIGRHWRMAGENERAAGAYQRAAAMALGLYAREDAVAHAHLAFELAGDDAARFAAMKISALAQVRAGDVARWDADVRRLENVAAKLGPHERFEALMLRERYCAQTVDYAGEERIVDAMFELAHRTKDLRHLAESYYARGFLYGQRGCVAESIVELCEARKLASALDDGDLSARIGQQLVSMLGRRGSLAEAKAELAAQRESLERRNVPIDRRLALLASESTIAAMLEDGDWLQRIGIEMLELARGIADEYLEARAHATLAHAAYMRRDFGSIRENFDRAIALFDRIGERRAVRVTCVNRSELELRLGRVDEAMRWLDACTENGAPLHGVDGITAQRVNRAEALLLMGQFEEALREAREAYALGLQVSESRYADQALTVLGAAEACTGELDAAALHLTEAIAGARAREAWGDVGISMCYLADVLPEAGKLDDVPALRNELEAIFARHTGLAIHPTRLCAAVARLAEACGDAAGAREWNDRGMALLTADLARLSDPADAEAYRRLPFHRALLERAQILA